MEVSRDDFSELEIGTSVDSFTRFVDSQRELFHNQIDDLQRIVVTQCKLTGVNPLSQEMAAGALSIKIGKRPRDLLNPKAVKYMQSVFSIKDAISKKESREISALFGVTVTQSTYKSKETSPVVKGEGHEIQSDISNRARVLLSRWSKLLARSQAMKKPNGMKSPSDIQNDMMLKQRQVHEDILAPLYGNSENLRKLDPPQALKLLTASSDDSNRKQILGINQGHINPVEMEKAMRSSACKELHDGALISSDPMMPIDPVPLNSVGPASVEEAPSCSTQDEALPGLDDEDKHFVENIFNFMRKEETFSGQVKLMEWILQIQNSSVLCWYLSNNFLRFLTKGGVMILATWLSQAAIEEQTSVLLVILKVLCHLPLHKALPVHMSAILQSVNRLRFYRTSDISNRARVLLSRWSKLLARSQAMKKPNGMKSPSDIQNDMMLKQRQVHEDILAPLYGNSENLRKLDPPQALKLLTASSDDSNRKQILETRERRKVQLVEQPGQKMAGRSTQATRSAPVNQGRPMSADDIQKAKMRAQFMQTKYGKNGSSNESKESKTEGLNKPSTTQASTLNPVYKVPVRPNIEEQKKPVILPSKISNKVEAPLDPKSRMDSKEPLWEKCRRVQIQWQTPPEIRLNDHWSVGGGENSKEVEVQKNRNRREKETIYQTFQEIPSNPKEPWDIEMDYDDTLTPQVPIEQPPDADSLETQVATNQVVNSAVSLATPSSQASSTAEPDLELLAVLLKNPELVFALTSGQAGNLSSEETVKLLDMIKAGGAGLVGSFNSGRVEEKVEVSLPSPTPSSNSGTEFKSSLSNLLNLLSPKILQSGWRPEVAKNPFMQPSSVANRVAYTSPGVATTSLMLPQATEANLIPPQQSSSMAQQFAAAMHTYSLPQTTANIPGRQLPSLHPARPTPASEMVLTSRNSSSMGAPLHNFSTTAAPSALQIESTSNIKPAPVSVTLNTPGRAHASFPPQPTRSKTHSQSLHRSTILSEPQPPAPLYPSRPPIGKMDPLDVYGISIEFT
ncbi:homeobox protein luminidependens [Quercus suber]|uniref:Homeobox protein luminidependens n=1 Tax=Quercus suber TaxID=58331 RepID=A0AAW0KAB8_QUESU